MANKILIGTLFAAQGTGKLNKEYISLNSKSKSRLNYTLDFRGTITSIGLLELSRLFDEMETNETLTITVTDKEIIADICKVLPKSPYEMNIIEQENSVSLISIKKRK